MDDQELADYPGLCRRSGGIWYVRKRVPVDLRHLETREQVRLSLETGDKKLAVRRYPSKLAEIERGFDNLRGVHGQRDKVSAALITGRLESLSHREIEALVSNWWVAREPIRQPVVGVDDSLAEVADSIAFDHQSLSNWKGRSGDPSVEAADRLLVDAGMVSYPRKVGAIRTRALSPAVDRSTAQYRHLCALVGRALQLEAALGTDHLFERQSAPHDPLFNPSGVVSPHGAAQIGTSRPLRDLISAYRSEREVKLGKQSTDRKYGLLFRVLEEVLGDGLPVSTIGREQCVTVLGFLQTLPPNAAKKFPTLTLIEAVAHAQAAGLRGLAPNTVGSYMQNFSAILRWAERGKWGVSVDTRGLIDSRRALVKRRGFEPDELRKLFGELDQFRSTAPTKFWVPALALYTGARAGEVCQLRAEDVQVVRGVHCLNLSEFDASGRRVEEKSLKTAASERYVPLHSELLDAGFLKFAASMAGEGRLFPDVTPSPGEIVSNRFSKWFGRFKRRIGFDEPSLVFHSFRHGFRDACREADISEETAMALGGWAGINQATRYGDRSRVPSLDRAMKKIQFEDFTLTVGEA